MIIDITMPRLSDTMKDGYIVEWHKSVGDPIQAGEDLLDIESDKATVSYPVDRNGVVKELLAAVDDTVEVGQPIARIEVDN